MLHRISRWLRPTYFAVRTLRRDLLAGFAETRSTIMAVADDLKNQIAALNTATNDVAAKIATLAQGIKNTMTDAELAEVKGGFSAITDRLKALAADPTNPVPAVSARFDNLQRGS